MCGIAGWIDPEADLSRQGPLLEAMGQALACRGPDAAGLWTSRHAALVHRRLVVIDPAGGAQPMVRRAAGDGPAGTPDDIVLTYNGELYNTAELREELCARGYAFSSRSDTEVLLRAYSAWGPDCVRHLNGIFAFGIWDVAAQRLLLARDRLGVKPLFYARRGRGLLFASELKALLRHPAVPPQIDGQGLAEVFALGPARTPGCGVFRGVSELRPGCTLILDRGGEVRTSTYWALQSAPHPDDPEETVATVRALLTDAVVRQLVSDVPIATLLSGGLDSSAVTAIAAREQARAGRGGLRTYSLEFVGGDADFVPTAYYADPDQPWVQRMVGALGTDHRTVAVDTPSQVEALGRAVTARDLPGLADVDASLYLFCRAVRAETTVALSGEAADEIFGGYPWCHWQEAVMADTFPWARATDARRAVLSPEARSLIRPEQYIGDRYRQALAEVPRLAGESAADARMREILYLNITRFLPTLLDRKDRMSMAVGLEVRVPFCDHRLVEYVWNIPWAIKCLGGQAKGVLRQALVGILPADVLGRRKVPYPRTFSPTYLSLVRQQLLQTLADRSSPLVPLVDVPALRRLAGEEAPPALQWFGQTMSGAQFYAYLLQVDRWLRDYHVQVV